MVLGNTRRGGTQAFIMNVLRNIDRNRYQIDFAVNLDFEGGWGPEMHSLGSNIYIMPVFKVYNCLSFVKSWNKFFTEHSYDIVHGHTTNSAGIYLNVAKKHGCKTIAHVHSTGFRGNSIEKISKRYFCRLAKKYADYWFACSDEAACVVYGKEYKQYRNYYEIPNAIDVERYQFKEDIRSKIRGELGIIDYNLLCGHVGTFSTPKNHVQILNIFSEILKRKLSAKLILIGEGYLKEQIELQAKKIAVFDSIIWKKNIGNVNEYLMAMDLFIFPSLFEGFGMASLEAQATGLNVIQSDKLPSETILTECANSISLLDSAEHWAEIGLSLPQRNRKAMNAIIASTKYNLSHTIDLISSIYSKMISKEIDK